MSQTVSASAKIILLGEHAVVYGQPALAVPFSSLRSYAQITAFPKGSGLKIIAADIDEQLLMVDASSRESDNPLIKAGWILLDYLESPPPDGIINLRSDIPIASGMGSGAAVTTALFRALLYLVNKSIPDEELNHLVYEVEKVHHGTPSGIDNTVIVFEQPTYFVRDQAPERFAVGQPFRLLIGNTGVESSTKIAVGDVRSLYNSNVDLISAKFNLIGELVDSGRIAIEEGDYTLLGKIMTTNHQLLQELTVSSLELDTLVAVALDSGALGAKLSGAGRGGNMIALVKEDRISLVQNALLKAGAVQVYQTIVGK